MSGASFGSGKNIFGSNRDQPKPNMFRLFFGMVHETKKQLIFRFASVCFGVSNLANGLELPNNS
jgi:hypothetical protein